MPPHVGGFVRRQVIEPLDLTVTDAAAALGVTRQALNNLLNEKASLTAEMALRIERAFGPKADHLMRMQLAYDMARARRGEASLEVRRVAARHLTEAGREKVRKQALRDLAAVRAQRRKGERTARRSTATPQPQIIAMVASGEMTAAEAARLLEIDPATVLELVDQAETPQPAPPPRPRPSTGTR
jgi:addiction module HigA family antidote